MGNGGSRTHFEIWYEFQPLGAPAPLRLVNRVARATWLALEKGGPVDILFDPRDPSISMIAYSRQKAFSPPEANRSAAFAEPLLVLVVFATWGLLMIRGPLRRRRLLQWGIVAPAEIVSVDLEFRGFESFTRATFRFLDSNGLQVEARSNAPAKLREGPNSSRPAVAAIWKNPLAFFEKDNSSDNVLYGLDGLMRL